MKKIVTVAVLGTGSRGSLFAELMRKHGGYKITAGCDNNRDQLDKFKKLLNMADKDLYADEESFFAEKRADLLVIATFDNVHVRQGVKAMKIGYDVLLEKPISDKKEELEQLLRTQSETGRTVTVCHELRYGRGYEKLTELLESGTVGKIMAIDAMERVAYWHQAQAYVRLQSEHPGSTYPTILAKCSHDLDLVQHYAGAECVSLSSIGDLAFFKKENRPEGATERCLDCPHAETCEYSAKRVYIDAFRRDNCPEFLWPYNKVSLEKPNTVEGLYEGLKTKCFGKCVFQCGVDKDPSVVDRQLVQMQFANGVQAVLKMVFAATAGRRINIFGVHGELLLDERSDTLEIRRFGEEPEIIAMKTLTDDGHLHGGGDSRLVAHLHDILTGKAVPRTSLKESVESHLMGIAAEKSRKNGGCVVKVHE